MNFLKLSPFLLVCFVCGLLIGCGAQSKVAGHIQRADAFYEQKDMERARIEYLNALRAGGENAHVLERLGVILQERGEIMPAYKAFSDAKRLQPTNLTVRAALGTILALGGDRTNALAEAEYLLSQDPAQGDAFLILASIAADTNEVQATRQRLEQLSLTLTNNAYLQLAVGNIRLRSRDFKGAEEAFKKAGAIEPDSAKFHLALGSVYWFQGQTNEADAELKMAADIAPVKSGARLRWADFKLKTGQVAAGKQILEETVEKAPDYTPALNSLAEIAVIEKRTNDAAVLIQRVLTNEPENYTALRVRARLKMIYRDYPGAIEDLEIIGRKYKADPSIPYQIAAVHLGSNDTGKALNSLDQALQINPNFFEAIYLRAELLLRAGNSTEAISALLPLTEKNPQRTQAHYLLANAYRARGATNDALNTYARIAELSPRDAQAPYLMGVIYRLQNLTNEARQAFENALTIQPSFVPPADDLIELDIAAGDFNAAMNRVNGYLKQYPDKPTPHFLHAKVLALQKKYDEAEAALLKAIDLSPDYQSAHMQLAQLYLVAGKTNQALAKYQQMVEKNPKDGRSLFQAAMLLEKKKDFPKAIEAYEKVLAIDPKHAASLNNLAYIISEHTQDSDRALAFAQRARESSPNDPFTADTLGWIYFKRGDYARAMPLIQQSAERLSSEPEVVFHYGMAHYMFGNESAARQLLTRAVDIPKESAVKPLATDALKVVNIDPAKADKVAIEDLQKRTQANPKDLFAFLRLAQIYGLQNNTVQARQNCESAYNINPKSISVIIQYASLCLDRLNDKPKALALAKEARALSQDAALGLEAGRIATRVGDYQWALPILRDVQAAQPDNARAQFYLAGASFGAGKASDALVELRRAAISSTDFPEKQTVAPLIALIELYLDNTLAQPAAAPTAAFLKVQPDFPPALVAVGIAYELQKDYPHAKDSYEKALVSSPSFVPAQRQLAILLAEKLADDNRAFELGSKIRSQLLEDADLSKALGKVAYRRSDFRDAVRFLKDSANRSKPDADLLYHLGLAQHQLRDRQAKQTLSQAVALDTNNKLADEARKVLLELN